jgi:sulfite exporter TauE/SafE
MLAALVIGLLGSLHCIGMCGPLVLVMPFGGKDGSLPPARMFSYHVGRIFTYAILGLAMGLIGGGLRYFFLQQWISIASGILLLIFYFFPLLMGSSLFPSLSSAWNRRVVSRLRRLLEPAEGRPEAMHMFGIGAVNGLLPCGLVYMALIGAISQPTVAEAALFMAVFGLGTSPALTAIIFANKLVLGKVKSSFTKVVPVFVVIVAALLILRGMGLGIPYISPADERNCCHGPEAVRLHHHGPLLEIDHLTACYDQFPDTPQVQV